MSRRTAGIEGMAVPTKVCMILIWIALIAASMGCATVKALPAQIIPDWHARSSGELDLSPEWRAWTAPRYSMQTTKDECNVTLFTMVTNAPPTEVRIKRILDWQSTTEAVITYKTTWKLPAGWHKFKVWFVEPGTENTVAYRSIGFRCAAGHKQ